jgi:hypothetical protein
VLGRQVLSGDPSIPPPPPPPPPQNPPTISAFYATPTTIPNGNTSTLHFTVQNASSTRIDKIGIELNSVNQVDVTPTQTTTYILTATNPGGAISTTTTVTVVEGSVPVVNIFSVSPSSIAPGESANLSWDVSDAQSITITNISLYVTDPVGSFPVNPSQTTTYTLTATNPRGSISTSTTLTVSAAPDTTLPTVSFTAPANNANVTIGTNVTVSASASDNIGVAKVDFFAGATQICSDTTAPYSCTWKVPTTANTSYTLKATATDTSGNTKSVTRTVNAKDTTAPTVVLTAPASGQLVARGATVTITANASDNVGVASVKFLVNNGVVCTDTAAPYSCSYKVSTASNISYSIKATATDASGNTTTTSTSLSARDKNYL